MVRSNCGATGTLTHDDDGVKGVRFSRHLDPRIGILCVEGEAVYYAFVDGYDKPEVRGDRAKVERALGIRKFEFSVFYRTRDADGECGETLVDAWTKTDAAVTARRELKESCGYTGHIDCTATLIES